MASESAIRRHNPCRPRPEQVEKKMRSPGPAAPPHAAGGLEAGAGAARRHPGRCARRPGPREAVPPKRAAALPRSLCRPHIHILTSLPPGWTSTIPVCAYVVSIRNAAAPDKDGLLQARAGVA